MACYHVTLPGGFTAIVCGVRGASKCSEQGCNSPHTKLCDFPLSAGRTCDRKLCDRYAIKVGPDRDYCPEHDEESFIERLELKGVVSR